MDFMADITKLCASISLPIGAQITGYILIGDEWTAELEKDKLDLETELNNFVVTGGNAELRNRNSNSVSDKQNW